MKKPKWVIEKEQAKKQLDDPYWVFGLHAVRDALANPKRQCEKLVVTKNARDRLGYLPPGLEMVIADPRKFPVPLDPGSVHQGAALLVRPLKWGSVREICAVPPGASGIVIALDRVTDPHNVGAIMRSAEVFGARAVIAPRRGAAPETGALAKTASGALERQPYLRVSNLGDSLLSLRDELGYLILGLAGEAGRALPDVLKQNAQNARQPIVLVLGAEGPGLRARTAEICDFLVQIPFIREFGSLNVSNAAAVALYAVSQSIEKTGQHV